MGISTYTGHIDHQNPEAIPNPWKSGIDPTIGFYLQYRPKPYYGFEINYLTTRLTGTQKDSISDIHYKVPQQDRSDVHTFKTGVTCYTISLVGYISRLINPGNLKPRSDVYVKAGIGQITLNTIAYLFMLESWDNRRKFVYPFSLGYTYHINQKWNAGIEAKWNLTNTDRLDGLHDIGSDGTIYYKAKEHFGTLQLTVSYKFAQKGRTRF